MFCVDVSVLLQAHRSDLPQHHEALRWLDGARCGHRPLGVPVVVQEAMLRIATNSRIWVEPSGTEQALRFLAALRESPAFVALEPGARHWTLLAELLESTGCRGDDVPDAALAATAMEHGAQVVSYDSGFARFPEARWLRPG